MAKKRKPQSFISLEINGHAMTGEKRDGKWTFICEWSDLTAEHNGTDDATPMIAAFTARAMLGVLTIQDLNRKLSK